MELQAQTVTMITAAVDETALAANSMSSTIAAIRSDTENVAKDIDQVEQGFGRFSRADRQLQVDRQGIRQRHRGLSLSSFPRRGNPHRLDCFAYDRSAAPMNILITGASRGIGARRLCAAEEAPATTSPATPRRGSDA